MPKRSTKFSAGYDFYLPFDIELKPDETIDMRILCNNLTAIWIYVQKHYDSSDELYKTLLTLMINEEVLMDTLNFMAC